VSKYGKLTRLGVAAVVLSLVVAGIAIASSRPTIVSTATLQYDSQSGTALVDSRGYALYMSMHDGKDKPRCSGNCKLNFRALTTKNHSVAKNGAIQKLLGRVKLGHNRYQVTYNHHPLYGSTTDPGPGRALQEGCKQSGGRWYVLNVNGHAIKPAVPCQSY
jgi:predicted lipoprotein with Yx(FWY)xxD motif